MPQKITLLILTLLLLAACARQPGQPGSAELLAHEWSLVEIDGGAPIGDRTPTLKLENGAIGGTTGCNSFGGSYRLQDDQLSMTEIYQTEMACMEPAGIMEQETAFLQALGQTAGYTLSGDRLELTTAAGESRLVFQK